MRNSSLVLLAFALTGFVSKPAAINTITNPVTTEFGTYVPNPKAYVPSMAPYIVPDSLRGVVFAGMYQFSDTAMSLLIKNGFVAIPSNANSMADIYGNSSLPAFVTTDGALHTFHKIYDYMLRIAEYNRFYGQLDTMLQGMMIDILALRAVAANDSLKLAITRAAALLDVARTLLTDTMTFTNDSAIKAMAVAETSLVYQHKGFDSSKVIHDLVEDFSQYVPRGHYTIAPRLEHYFRAMMYLGRMNMRDSTVIHNPSIARIETMQAIVLCRLLATRSIGTASVSNVWAGIYDPTSFFVGRSDDLNFRQYTSRLDSVMGPQIVTGDINNLYTKLDSIIICLRQLPKPQILSGLANEQGFRIMGQRFIPDSYIFGQLVFTNVGTGANPRLFPRGLDLFAAMGSARARQILIQLYYEDSYLHYTDQLDSVTKYFSTTPSATWAENIYRNWMYTIAPLLDIAGNGFPAFMKNTAWTDKSLITSSGSWAELRHDAILYAKQSYTGSVGMCSPAPIPISQGYVEPDPEVFGRLASMASYMQTGLTKIGLSSLLPITKLTRISTLCTELQGIAIKELQGGDVTLKEYADIDTAYLTLADLENFSQYPIPPSSSFTPKASDSTISVIADVHTDPNSLQVLEVGVGKPMRLFVVVPIEGKLQLCQGAMFSYYEFKQPMNNRLTDEQWRAMLTAGTAPAMPEWISSFSASKDLTAYRLLELRPHVFFSSDSIPTRCRTGDSVVALVQSPSIVVEANGSLQFISGILLSSGIYRVAIPPQALGDSSILTINSQFNTSSTYYCPSTSTPISYRKLLVRQRYDVVALSYGIANPLGTPRVQGNRVLVPHGTAWRIVDMRGRQVGLINASKNEWIAPQRYARMPLLLAPCENSKGKIVRMLFN